jgi:hypothetical protein
MLILRRMGYALVIGVPIVVSTGSTLHAYAATAARIENKKLADAISGAQTDAKAGHFAEALAKAKEADAIPGKPPALTRQIHRMIVAYAISAKDYPSALAELDAMIAVGEATQHDLDVHEELRSGGDPR